MRKKSKFLQQQRLYLKSSLRENEICPDGVLFFVDWDRFQIGMSLFVPAINTQKLREQLNIVAKKRKWRWETRERIENGCWGVRFWRVL